MRLLIATDMLLDLIAERPESIEAWNKLNALELTGSAELWAAASSYDALRAQLAEVIDDADVRSALRSTMSFITICSVDGSDVRFALDHADLPYEAAIAEACARKIQADYVVTNQGPLAVSRAIKRVTPTELFDDIEAERGIAFDLVDF